MVIQTITKGNKTFGIRKKTIIVFFSKKSKFCVSTYLYLHFFYLYSIVYESTFISANLIVFDIGYSVQTNKKCFHLDEK